MMMKGLQQQHHLVEENMSNLTSASGEASVSSNQQSSSFTPNPIPAKKKRSLPGNPDPDAEVIGLSPKTLMATNRFVCEICNKGFQRDQNLQLHRRGHNLPWKLKQRSNKEVRKKVYICPEVTCVHHEPSRALGDLTGIKKHFSRKHGEKKWKCDKCNKKYAVQSDWKAHSKICGTREYRCDCGTLFSRRDSFITHRAFCDALAEESARAMAVNPLANHLLFTQPTSSHEPSSLPHTSLQGQFPHLMTATEANTNIMANHGLQEFSLKREQQQQQFNMMQEFPSWIDCQGSTSLNNLEIPSSIYPTRPEQDYSHENSTAPPNTSFSTPYQTSVPSPHMSATALLQKAAQMGATMSRTPNLGEIATHSSGFGLGLSSHLSSGDGGFGQGNQEMTVNPLYPATNFDGSFGDAFGGMLGSKRKGNSSHEGGGSGSVGGVMAGNDGVTKDFLSLRAFSHRDIFNMSGMDPCMSSSNYEQNQQSKKPWHV